jgi:hypothetical protein
MGDSPTPDLESLIKFQKRSQLFIGAHNETLSVAAMRVSNPDRLLLRINSPNSNRLS